MYGCGCGGLCVYVCPCTVCRVGMHTVHGHTYTHNIIHVHNKHVLKNTLTPTRPPPPPPPPPPTPHTTTPPPHAPCRLAGIAAAAFGLEHFVLHPLEPQRTSSRYCRVVGVNAAGMIGGCLTIAAFVINGINAVRTHRLLGKRAEATMSLFHCLFFLLRNYSRRVVYFIFDFNGKRRWISTEEDV